MERTHIIDTLKKEGEKVRICGWACKIRDHGSLVFIDVRDWTGQMQVVIDQSKLHMDSKIGLEYVIEVIGNVRARDKELVNKNIETGKIEIEVEGVTILNKSKTPPFPLDSSGEEIEESIRLKYRYIDIRRKRVRDLIERRHELMMATREWFSKNGFIEVQTPLLTVSSPEGARDYLVPSRTHRGKFYALPQAPQQYKQLLMVGGVDRYFQIAPCFRDEDPRADRHSGDFYQIDVECSFVEKEEFFDLVEPYFKHTATLAGKQIKEYPIPRISYKDVLEEYGTEKPDLRFEMKLIDFTDEFTSSGMDMFKNIESAKGILVDKEFSRSEIEQLTDEMKQEGASGMAWFTVEKGVLGGSIVKYFDKDSQESILKKCTERGYKVGGKQTIFVFAGDYKGSCKLAGILRNKMGEKMGLKDPNVLAFAWIVDFHMFTWDEQEKRWDFEHNPFSMPQGGMEALLKEEPENILAHQYDIACNGYELGSGSIRNYHPETFVKAFEIAGYSKEEIYEKFGHMISAFEYGAPPHGGYALGFDRFMMLLFDEDNIKEVYAFPKSNAQELMTGAPREVSKEDLDVLGIEIKKKLK